MVHMCSQQFWNDITSFVHVDSGDGFTVGLDFDLGSVESIGGL